MTVIKLLALLPLAVLGLAKMALAACHSAGGGGTPGGGAGGGSTPSGLNPLNVETIQELIVKILDIVAQIGLPIVALAIVYVGFLFVTARGNEEQLKRAKSAFIWTMVGASIVLGSWVISRAICDTIEGLR